VSHRAAGRSLRRHRRSRHRQRTRSRGSVNVVVKIDRAAGASSAPKPPCSVRALTSTAKLCAEPPTADTTANPTRPITNVRLRPNRSPSRPPEQHQAAKRQRIRRHDPLAVGVGEVQRLLRRGQRDVHDRAVQHHHQLSESNQYENQPASIGCRRGRRCRSLGCRHGLGSLVLDLGNLGHAAEVRRLAKHASPHRATAALPASIHGHEPRQRRPRSRKSAATSASPAPSATPGTLPGLRDRRGAPDRCSARRSQGERWRWRCEAARQRCGTRESSAGR